MKKKRMKQKDTTAPKEGKKKTIGKNLSGLFNAAPKKTEADQKPVTHKQYKSAVSAAGKRLKGVII